MSNRTKRIDTLVLTVLLMAAAATWGPVFGDMQGYIAAAGGVVLGVAIAVLGYAAGLTIWLTVILGVVGYLVFGPAIALRPLAGGGFLPNMETTDMLVVQTIEGWKDLLTLTPPAGAFVGPTVLPFFVGTVCSLCGASIVVRTRRGELSLIFVAIFLVTGIIFGLRDAPYALWIGLLVAMLGLLWWSRLVGRRAAAKVTDTNTTPSQWRRRRTGAMVLVGIGAVVSAVLTPMMTDANSRYTTRDHVIPPLSVQEYASPLAEYRTFIDDRADVPMFTVKGLEEGQRIRYATLDVYNGIVYNMSGDISNSFRRVGTRVATEEPTTAYHESKLSFTIKGLSSVWIPGSGILTSLDFTGPRDAVLSSGVYYSAGEETILNTTPIREGDTYTTSLYVTENPGDKNLATVAFGSVIQNENTNVPAAVPTMTPDLIKDASTPIAQARAIEQYFRTNGYYTVLGGGAGAGNQVISPEQQVTVKENYNAADARPGHRTQRIQSLLTSDAMIGDDEQYAVAMALMARSAKMPARVVMGFYPDSYPEDPNEAVTILGTHTHVWVEIYFDGYGWISFDPAPNRDQILVTEINKPKPNPRPLVVQPPDPPDEPSELSIIGPKGDDSPEPEPGKGKGWFVYVAAGLGIVLLLLSPFILILLFKLRRTKRRRTRGTPDARAAGAWEDVLDVARDGRIGIDSRMTRSEQASAVAGEIGKRSETVDVSSISATAQMVDASVFGEALINDQGVEEAWEQADAAKAAIRSTSKRGSRLSLRSLRRKRGAPRGRRQTKESDD